LSSKDEVAWLHQVSIKKVSDVRLCTDAPYINGSVEKRSSVIPRLTTTHWMRFSR